MTRKTSITVCHQIEAEGLLSQRRWQVYSLLYQFGPCTSSELFEHYKKEFQPAFRYNANVHSRLNELKERGVAEELGTRACSISGNNVILWDVTDCLPREVPKSEIKITRKELEHKVAAFRKILVTVWKDNRTPPWIKDVIRENTKQFRKEAT